MNPRLGSFGWSADFNEAFEALDGDGLIPARVVRQQRGFYDLAGPEETRQAVLAGSLRHFADGAADLPVVGDWVACTLPDAEGPALIHAVLPRQSKLSRKTAGLRATEQLVAANLDVVLLVMGLDGDFNLRRLERFLLMVEASGAQPVVVLNKVDLCPEAEERFSEVQATAPGVPVFRAAAKSGDLGGVESCLEPGKTAVLVGSSGVGKSTLINQLLGESRMRTAAVRESDDRGQHTTTHRELFRLPGGALMIDNPGIRELQPWDAASDLEESFDDVMELATECRFRNCTHGAEPGCAVQGAIRDGVLDPARLRNMQALEKEALALERRKDVRAARAADRRTGKFYKSVIEAKKRGRREPS